ncbi:MAG: LTA synthase family protein, partial [Lachnospiraceae bacterium]|nr:LTA synthase family protein [Lachnospiraceae bacterium]
MGNIRFTKRSALWTIISAAALFVMAVNYKLFGRGLNNGSPVWMYVFFGLAILIVFTDVRLILKESKRQAEGKKPERKRISPVQFIITLIVFPVIWHFGVELIVSNKLGRTGMTHNLMSIGICAAVFVILFLFCHSLKAALVIGSVFYFVFGTAQYYTITFRSVPVMWSDLMDVGAAFAVVGGYTLAPTKGLITVAIVFFTAVMNSVMDGDRVPGLSPGSNIAGRVIAVIMALALVIGIGRSEAFTASVGTLSRPLKNFQNIGSQLCFIQSIKNAQIRVPDGYSAGEIRTLADGYIKKASEYNAALKDGERPNVIAIMNESFCDIDVTGAHGLADENMKYVSSMKDNTVKGQVMVSTYGGGTGRSEFEFNACASMHLFDSSTSPYAMFGQRLKYALASQYSAQGYRTVAIHPHVRTNYNRPRTYDAMGFDEYLSKEDFEGAERIRKYVSDEADYEKIISLVEETEDPLFAFTVTMQNHGGYDYYPFENEVSVGDGNEAAGQFATLIKYSDEAVKKLLEYFEKSDEKTLVVMFGDHFPALGSSFFNEYNGFSKDDPDISKSRLYYQTPYFIWANYDIPEEESLTSLNYLGLRMLELSGSRLTPYQMYLRELREKVPAFSLRLYSGTDGELHEFGTD